MICFFFAPHDSSSINRFHPNDVHTQWILLIQTAYGADIKIINNSNSSVTYLDTGTTVTNLFVCTIQGVYEAIGNQSDNRTAKSSNCGRPPNHDSSTIGSTQTLFTRLSAIDRKPLLLLRPSLQSYATYKDTKIQNGAEVTPHQP
jgi:hypothetical protein